METLIQIVQFAFIVLLPILLVVGGLVSLFALGALFDALENPGALRSRLDGLFRKPATERPLDAHHYYQAPWRPSTR
jgi:hypothetical protein